MRARQGFAVLWLGLVACDEGSVLELRGIEAAPVAAAHARQVSAWDDAMSGCRPGKPTRLKVALPPGSGVSVNGPFPEAFVEARGTLYFATNLFDGSATLWRSDGTEHGTLPVKSFPPALVGSPALRGLTAVGSRVFFQLDQPSTGLELWVSDGTTKGTRLVEDLTPGPAPTRIAFTAAQGGRLTFVREVPVAPGSTRVELWRTDGSSEGTVRLRDFGSTARLGNAALALGDHLLFFLGPPGQGTLLWRTDGTSKGTATVKRLDADVVAITDSMQWGGQGVFLFPDGPNTEVWKTDGTTAGTMRLDAFGKYVGLLGVLDSTVYVASGDTATRRLRIQSLSMNGGGKTSITTLPNPYADEADAYPYVQRSAVSGGKLYFTVAISSPGPAPRAAQLWVSDGTAQGTEQLAENLSLSDEYASPLFSLGDGAALFAGATRSAGLEPWFTAGTLATTRGPLADVRPGPAPSLSDGFTRVGDRVYFRAGDDTGAMQPWFVPCGAW
ncbi:hypothetical protein LZ198_03580 [Myxococcus sp. K15C18031901]|uniref:hypothetical protein n=1 Tax=Myxococcus dinghuensis TaxID=2906761 RepID=UPI0020A74818|nr:hypothetical protein [Myxococcus dinghuensis]MCP3097953.1 hypothetical protein [Myxococcus dinghuensis]